VPIRQAGPASTRSHSGAGGWSGLRVRWRCRSDKAAFPGAGFWESKAFGFLLLLLAENYNQTTNDPTTETQSAQRTHRDVLKGIPGSHPACRSLRSCGLTSPDFRLSFVAAACPGCVARLVALDCLAGTRGGRRPGRAKTTGSREGAIGAKFR
jgi:hypothetical protein